MSAAEIQRDHRIDLLCTNSTRHLICVCGWNRKFRVSRSVSDRIMEAMNEHSREWSGGREL